MAGMTKSGNGKVIDFGEVRTLDDRLLPKNKWTILKVLEEAAELVEAGKDYVKWCENHPKDDGEFDVKEDELYGDMLSELADVVMTVADVCNAFDIDDDQLHDAIASCIARNADRGRITDGDSQINIVPVNSGLPDEAFDND